MSMHHYTDIDTLALILQTKSLLATRVDYLNDTVEITQGFNLLRKQLGKHLGELPRASSDRIALEGPRLRHALKMLEDLSAAPKCTFVISFSRKDDDLSQWRGYTTGGRGVRLGFNESLLQSLANDQQFVCKECGYAYHDVGQMPEAASEAVKLVRGGLVDERTMRISAAQVKHFLFRDESEVRLIHDFDGTKPVECIGHIPRVRFDLSADPNLCLTDVRMCPSPAYGEPELRALLDQAGFPALFPIGPSRIPYRPRPVASP